MQVRVDPAPRSHRGGRRFKSGQLHQHKHRTGRHLMGDKRETPSVDELVGIIETDTTWKPIVAFVRARFDELADATADAQRDEDELYGETGPVSMRDVGGLAPYWAPGEGMAASWEWFDRFVAAGRAIITACELGLSDYDSGVQEHSEPDRSIMQHVAAIWS